MKLSDMDADLYLWVGVHPAQMLSDGLQTVVPLQQYSYNK